MPELPLQEKYPHHSTLKNHPKSLLRPIRQHMPTEKQHIPLIIKRHTDNHAQH